MSEVCKTPEQIAMERMSGKAVPMKTAGGIPAGKYQAEFLGIEYLPAKPADPMTGKGGKQWASILFRWKILEGELAGQVATRETPDSQGIKSKFITTVQWMSDRPVAEGYDLSACIGKRYTIAVGAKLKLDGQPNGWNEVVQCV